MYFEISFKASFVFYFEWLWFYGIKEKKFQMLNVDSTSPCIVFFSDSKTLHTVASLSRSSLAFSSLSVIYHHWIIITINKHSENADTSTSVCQCQLRLCCYLIRIRKSKVIHDILKTFESLMFMLIYNS